MIVAARRAYVDFLVDRRGFEPMAIAGAGRISSYSSLRESMRGPVEAPRCCARSWLRSKCPATCGQRFVCAWTQAASWRCARADISLRRIARAWIRNHQPLSMAPMLFDERVVEPVQGWSVGQTVLPGDHAAACRPRRSACGWFSRAGLFLTPTLTGILKRWPPRRFPSARLG